MIPAPAGIYAIFKNKTDCYTGRRRVVAFDDHGHPLIAAGSSKHGLIDAISLVDYGGLEDDMAGTEDVIAAIPAGGWRARYIDKEDENASIDMPLVGFAIQADGCMSPAAILKLYACFCYGPFAAAD